MRGGKGGTQNEMAKRSAADQNASVSPGVSRANADAGALSATSGAAAAGSRGWAASTIGPPPEEEPFVVRERVERGSSVEQALAGPEDGAHETFRPLAEGEREPRRNEAHATAIEELEPSS